MNTRTLKKLTVKDFTSYEYSEVEFVPGVNYVLGLNGQGKSNLLLALQIVLFADDFPDSLIRWGAKEAYIEVEFMDGASISRTRNVKSQKVVLRDEHGVETVFTNMKTSTEQVQQFTGFMPVKLDENSSPEMLQYLTADDPYFLLNKSPEVVLRMLSALISGQGIESAKLWLSKQAKTISVEQDVNANAQKKTTANISLLTSPDVTAHLEKAEALEKDVSAYVSSIEFLETCKEAQAILAASLTNEEKQELEEAYAEAHNLSTAFEQLQSNIQFAQDCKDAIVLHDTIEKEKTELQIELATLRSHLETYQEEMDSVYSKCKTCGKMTICEGCIG